MDALPRPEVVPGHVMSWLIKIDISYVGKTWLSNFNNFVKSQLAVFFWGKKKKKKKKN